MKDVYKKVAIIFGGVIIVVGIFVVLFTYFIRIDTPALNYLRGVLRVPAVIVGDTWITIKDVETNTASIRQFYENQDFASYGIRIDFKTEDGEKRLKVQQKKMLNKIVEDIAVEKMAEEWGITLSDAAVRSAMDRPMNEMGTRENVESQLANLYGWDLDDFGQKVVRTQLLREKVAARFDQENPITDDMRDTMTRAQKELGDGRTFADVAAKYSEGATAQEGGVMGWFAQTQMQDAIGKQVFAMERGTYTDVIETPLGLHIVNVNDVSEDDGVTLVHISQIVVKRQTFADYLSEYLRGMNVRVLMPGYEWDSERAMIVFSDSSMIDFEENMRAELQRMQEEQLNTNEEKR
jgi:hypothetical protein